MEPTPGDDDSMLVSPFEEADVRIRMLLSAINSAADTDWIPLVAVTVLDRDVDCEPMSADDAPNDNNLYRQTETETMILIA